LARTALALDLPNERPQKAAHPPRGGLTIREMLATQTGHMETLSPTLASEPLRLSEAEFRLICDVAERLFGIHLTDKKHALVETRIGRMLGRIGQKTLQEFMASVESDPQGAAATRLADELTTNYTFFFRERQVLEHFAHHALPHWLDRLRHRNSNDLRVWSAGCSTGEEPFTLLMLMMDALGADYANWRAGVLATDISTPALATARAAVYPEDQLAGVPVETRRKYFRKTDDKRWAVMAAVREQAIIRRLNLVGEPFPFAKPFHMVFCRNVLIYFDAPTQARLVEQFHRVLEPGGYLFVGLTESLHAVADLYAYVAPGIYRKRFTEGAATAPTGSRNP
jgi:chemotaxis protein methyltransferase CheR